MATGDGLASYPGGVENTPSRLLLKKPGISSGGSESAYLTLQRCSATVFLETNPLFLAPHSKPFGGKNKTTVNDYGNNNVHNLHTM